MEQVPQEHSAQNIEYLFRYILATFKASGVTSKVSLCCVLKETDEEWYVLVAGTFRMDSLKDFERYQRTHGSITPLH